MKGLPLLFILGNAGLLLLVGLLWLWPTHTSYIQAQRALTLMHSRYALYTAPAPLHEPAPAAMLPSTQFMQVLADLGHLARSMGLQEVSLTVAEPVGTHAPPPLPPLQDMRATLTLAGSPYALALFSNVFDATTHPAHLHHLALLLSGDEAQLTVQFSVFGY